MYTCDICYNGWTGRANPDNEEFESKLVPADFTFEEQLRGSGRPATADRVKAACKRHVVATLDGYLPVDNQSIALTITAVNSG